MPIGAITMILTNVGLHIYNNWCGSRQNKQLQQKREEFEQAARERNTQRMWQIMREGQELTRQLEEEKHQLRLEELKNDIGSLLQKLTYAATINNWPLNVLPIVMKNQALGNLLANQEESIALHCIFTPSNSIEFNRTVFPRIEEALETYCNQHWSVMSDHPVLFYSGAWKSQQSPTEVQIDSMRTALSNLPTLLITPFFRPNDGKLVFHVRLWGVGASSSDEFSIPEIAPTGFQRSYQKGDDYMNDADLMDELIEDLVPYLQCLIGYMADTYFWSSLGKVPHLPLLVTNGTINTDGMKYLVDDSREYYDKLLLTSEENAKENPFMQENLLNLYEGIAELWDKNKCTTNLENIFIAYCYKNSGKRYDSIEDAIQHCPFNISYKQEITRFLDLYKGKHEKSLKEILHTMDGIDFDYSILTDCNKDRLLQLANDNNPAALYRLGELYEFSINVTYHPIFANECYANSEKKGFILAIAKNSIENNEIINNDYCEKLKLLHNAGVEQASILLAQIYFYGLGCNMDKEKSIKILNSIHNSTHPYYYYTGATLLNEAYGEDEKKAIFKLYKIAADMGYVRAIEKIMMIYLSDDFIPRCPEKHFEYAKKCAEQGSLIGITRLGYCYAAGLGTSKDIKQAIKVLRIAEKKNYADAVKLLNIITSNNER